MTQTLSQFSQLKDAEEYLEFFGLPYDPKIVNVNRLHILKKFSQYVKEVDANFPDLNEEEKLNQYSNALQRAYNVFLSSTPVQEKLFKVFNDKPKNIVTLNEINVN
jgi:nitrogenase-stabilizing/protective protein